MSIKNKVLLGIFLVSASAAVIAGTANTIVVVPQTIPAISQAGLIGMAFIIGIVGARLIHKIRASKT